MEEQQVPEDAIDDSAHLVEITEPYPDGYINIMAELRQILGFEDGDESSKDSTLDNGLSSWGCMDCEGFGYGDDENSVSLKLKLNYQEVLDAWSDRGSLWADHELDHDHSLSMIEEVPVVEKERTRREASVIRYKEKRQSRLFEKKIRYQIHKYNAYKRPRFKGRFVKTVC